MTGPAGRDRLRTYADRFDRRIDEVRDELQSRKLSGDASVAAIARDLMVPAAAVLGPATFFADLATPRGDRHVRVCGGAACFAASAGEHVSQTGKALGVVAGAAPVDGTSMQEVHCLGYCYAAPAVLDGDLPCVGDDAPAQVAGARPRRDPPIPVRSISVPVVTAGLIGAVPPWTVWPEVVATHAPDDVLAAVQLARLRGRGGAGFPAARKWAAARAGPPPRIVVANGDEGDPGSYVDRLLMESDPHRVLEGLALAAYAVGANQALIFVRSEYPRARFRLRSAIRDAYEDGHLGRRVHGSGFDLDVRVVDGAGSYVSGEETALLNGVEGLRGVVRPRPPYPSDYGLAGRPTVVNNVETLAAVPWIVRHGGDAYAHLGTPDETGTIVVCLSGAFTRTGAYEVEVGMPVRTIVEDLGGGLREGSRLRALQVGGPLGGFLGPDDLDVPLSEAGLAPRGAALGHAGIVAFDDRLSGEQVINHLWSFVAEESCGGCSPCRVGSRRGLLLAGLAADGQVTEARAAVLRSMAVGSLCAFGRRVPAAVRSVARVYGLPGWPQ